MASPQVENGYTPIANEILEHLVKLPLNGTQWRIIAVVWRYTYGFSRKKHELSLSFVSNALGCPKKQVQREVNRLVEFKILVVESEAAFNRSRCFSFNKDYTDYSPLNRLQSVNKTMDQGTNWTTQEGANQTTKKTKKQTTNSTEKLPEEFELFYSQYPNATEKQRTFRNWKIALKHSTVEEIMQAAKNYSEEVKNRDRQYIKTSANFLGRDKTYLDYINRNPEVKDISPIQRREIIVEEIDRL